MVAQANTDHPIPRDLLNYLGERRGAVDGEDTTQVVQDREVIHAFVFAVLYGAEIFRVGGDDLEGR